MKANPEGHSRNHRKAAGRGYLQGPGIGTHHGGKEAAVEEQEVRKRTLRENLGGARGKGRHSTQREEDIGPEKSSGESHSAGSRRAYADGWNPSPTPRDTMVQRNGSRGTKVRGFLQMCRGKPSQPYATEEAEAKTSGAMETPGS